MPTAPRIPPADELTGDLRHASQAELLALSSLAAWMAQHKELLATGRRHSIQPGVTPEMADFIGRSFESPAAGLENAGNLVLLGPGDPAGDDSDAVSHLYGDPVFVLPPGNNPP